MNQVWKADEWGLSVSDHKILGGHFGRDVNGIILTIQDFFLPPGKGTYAFDVFVLD